MIGASQRHAIDLTRHHFMREWKDLVLFGTWLYNNDQEAEEPALVVMPRHRRVDPGKGIFPVVIALSVAFRYNDPRYLAQVSRAFAKSLGFSDEIANAHKIAEAIHSHLGDLLKMPVSPTQQIIVADATVDIGGRKRSIEVVDYQPLAQL
jgi:hypothetical protein